MPIHVKDFSVLSWPLCQRHQEFLRDPSGSATKSDGFDAYVDNDTVQEHLDDFYKTVSAEDQVLLCSDLYGGSVNQSMYPYLQKPNTRLVSGVNMTFMMNVLCEEELSDERLEEILEESRSYLRRVNLETNETEDESFF